MTPTMNVAFTVVLTVMAAGVLATLTAASTTGSWSAQQRRRLRRWRRDEQCVPDPDRPGKRFNPSDRCPHGTTGGHDNWGCQCLTAPDGGPGCEPVKVSAVQESRGRARARRAETNLIQAAMDTQKPAL